MAFLKSKHPWNGRYAIPKSVLAEPRGVGVNITYGPPRGTISRVGKRVAPWKTKFVLPKNVLMESPGQGVNISYGRERGTIDMLNPSEFAGLGSLDHSVFNGHTLKGTTLDGTTLSHHAVPLSGDPIVSFGAQAAKEILKRVNRVSPAKRKAVLTGILTTMDHTLADAVTSKAASYKGKLSATAALEKALQEVMSGHFVARATAAGRTGKVSGFGGLGADEMTVDPSPAPPIVRDWTNPAGLDPLALGKGTYTNWKLNTEQQDVYDTRKHDKNIASGKAYFNTDTVSRDPNQTNKSSIVRLYFNEKTKTLKVVRGYNKNLIKDAAKDVGGAVKDAVKAVGNLACQTSRVASAAGAGGINPSVQGGMAVMGAMCGGGQNPVAPQESLGGSGIGTTTLLIGAGALAALVWIL